MFFHFFFFVFFFLSFTLRVYFFKYEHVVNNQCAAVHFASFFFHFSLPLSFHFAVNVKIEIELVSRIMLECIEEKKWKSEENSAVQQIFQRIIYKTRKCKQEYSLVIRGHHMFSSENFLTKYKLEKAWKIVGYSTRNLNSLMFFNSSTEKLLTNFFSAVASESPSIRMLQFKPLV